MKPAAGTKPLPQRTAAGAMSAGVNTEAERGHGGCEVGWEISSAGRQEGQKQLGKLVRAPSLSISTGFLG